MSIEVSEGILTKPIPNLDFQRVLRWEGYADIPLDSAHPLANDPIVELKNYGVPGLSYYARPNTAIDEPIPDAKPEIMVRKDVAERLARVNEFLQDADFLSAYFDGPIGIYVADGLRSVELQKKVYEEIYPAFLRRLHPEYTEERILSERDAKVAKPSPASPHASGGAVDLKVIKIEELEGVDLQTEGPGKSEVHFDYSHTVKHSVEPDYMENTLMYTTDKARTVRRVLYHVMGAAGFTSNPKEIWHYGIGDRLSAKLSGKPAYYGMVEGSPDYEQQ